MGTEVPGRRGAVVPILQARGRFRTEYSGSTLRDHLGLDRPVGYRAADGRV